MKKVTIVLTILILVSLNIFAQGPTGFSYQAVVRDNSGDLITNQNVSLRISIRDVTANGTILYRETHTASTNDFGLVNLTIGTGTPVSGNFDNINWGINAKFISVDLDPSGGSNFVVMGTSQLLNVPYSILALQSAGMVLMTSAERDALLNPYLGMQIMNEDTRKINYYDGYSWLEITGVKQAGFTCGNPLLDSRDGQYYNTVELGGNCWMAENLNYGVMINGSIDQSDNGIVEKYCYSNTQNLCDDLYGALYQWLEMMQYTTSEGPQGICPEGWHLPTEVEWNNLVMAAGGPSNAGTNLVQGGATGFDALMAGQSNLFTYPFIDIGQRAYFWTSTQASTGYAKNLYLINNNPQVYTSQQDMYFGHSVRCVKD
ncbi:MAG: hypothetical protein K9H58_08215 [Bacteroidales bacterium]|nr:hypothetical protein [Bacteroidales bacterium]